MARQSSITDQLERDIACEGLLEKEQINYDQGGYYHVYSPTDPEQIATDMRRQLNDWYAKMGQLVQEFEDKYDSIDEPTPDEAF